MINLLPDKEQKEKSTQKPPHRQKHLNRKFRNDEEAQRIRRKKVFVIIPGLHLTKDYRKNSELKIDERLYL